MLAALERDERVGIRWTTPAEWHVTLAFLGDVDPGQVASALAGLAHPPATARFEAKVGRLGRDALVVPVAGLDLLAAEVRRCVGGLAQRSFDGRAFHGHLTLARVKRPGACSLTGEVLEGEWRVNEVTVVGSRLHPDGPRYTVTATIPLTVPGAR